MELVNVSYIGSNDQYQTYSPQDLSLINTVLITGTYGNVNDYIEYFIKDLNNNVLFSNYYTDQYSIGNDVNPNTDTTTKLFLDPETDVRSAGYNRGIVNIKYNFFSKQLLSAPAPAQNFWIKEISTSRTEIKTARQDLSNTQLQDAFVAFNTALAADPYYPTFYLNFGADIQLIAVNAAYIEEDGSGYILFKLYEPLPVEFDVKSTFWVVRQVAEPAEFNVTINVTPETITDSTPLQGPNFKVNLKEKVGQTTPYYSYNSLLLTSVTSSYQQLRSMMQEKGIEINVDYSNFSNFIHFSSATERLHNFVYKLQQIESASLGLTQTNTVTAKILLQNQIDSVITNFDGYEYYLYFTSESTAWPKVNPNKPYELYSVTSSQARNWLGNVNTVPTPATMSMYWSASYYDDQNKDLLIHSTPAFITEDDANVPYLVFLNMIGQHFDNIWIYIKDVTNHYSAENNPFVGISLDQVADALRSFGVQLYTNTSVTDNIYYSLLGINPTGSNLPVTSSQYSTTNILSSSIYPKSGDAYLSSSLLLPPFGEEKINRYVITFVTGSNGQAFETLPSSQITAEVYKRIYHNLPYLLKTRGTERGVKALINTFGIPESILTVHEYGGYNFNQVAGIQEISNTKILTGSVLSISSSLLSPYTTTQYFEYNTIKTSNDVEVGFSPADSINANITSSGFVTASNQPGYFNIMQLIGAPALQYSSSYIPLVEFSNNYFTSEYTQRYNVWDFIRVIKYYNNSLFKMLRDWVPARSSADTGIVIKSHMLERNKYARHEPYVEISGSIGMIGMVSITGSDGLGFLYNTSYTASVPVQYQSNSIYLANQPGTVYVVSNTGIENYTGDYSGSQIDIPNYFPQVDVSSYLYPWTSSVAPSQHGGANIMFLTYSVDYLSANITGSVISQRFLNLDYTTNQAVPVNYGLITQSLSQSLVIGPVSQSQQPYSQYAELQDYNYALRRSIMPRYSGSYLSGLFYNYYTSQSATYSGDISYGNSPVINYYTDKLGLFTQIQTSSFIPGAVNASLGYLADVSGGLFELNQNNKNWQDLQNIFVAGETLTVKQFDNKKFSNQVSTDGVKTIYNSGYNYTPQIYYRSGSDTRMYFSYLGSAVVGGFTAQNKPNYFISGSDTGPTYAVSASRGFIYNIFDNVISNVGNYYSTGSTTGSIFPSFSTPYAGVRSFAVDLSVNVEFPTASQEVTYSFNVKQNGVLLEGGSAVSSFKSTSSSGVNTPGGVQYGTTLNIIDGTFLEGPYVFTGPFDVYNNLGQYQGTTSNDSWISASQYSYEYDLGSGVVRSSNLFVDSLYDTSGYLAPIAWWDRTVSTFATPIFNLYSATSGSPSPQLNATLTLNLSTVPTSFDAGDVITFELLQTVTASEYLSANKNFTASVSIGSLKVNESSTQGSYPYATGSFIGNLTNLTSELGKITLSTSLSNFYGYQFVPYFVSGGIAYSSSLYTTYGDINVPFLPQAYDKLILRDTSGNIQDLTVYSSSFTTGNQVELFVIPGILPNWVTNPEVIERVLLLRRYEDEQNVILTFNKAPGVTSYGFLIPNTVNPTVTENINTLQAAVQSQILNMQSIPSIDTISGGTFD